jgi:hypothetical protein
LCNDFGSKSETMHEVEVGWLRHAEGNFTVHALNLPNLTKPNQNERIIICMEGGGGGDIPSSSFIIWVLLVLLAVS